MKDKKKILKRFERLSQEDYEELAQEIDSERDKKKQDFLKELTYLYLSYLEQIKERISIFLIQYANSDGVVDVVSSKKLLKESELTELKKRIKKIINQAKKDGVEFDKDLSDQLNKILKVKSITRLTGLLYEIKATIELLYGNVTKLYTKLNKNVIKYVHARTLYFIFKTAKTGNKNKILTEEQLNYILQKTWRRDSMTYEKAIWNKKRNLQWDIDNKITQGVHFGAGYTYYEEVLDKLTRNNLGYFKSTTNTDLSDYTTETVKEVGEDLGITQVMYVAVMDDVTTPECAEMNGTVMNIEDAVAWENAPPLHYGCRCVLVLLVKEIDSLTGEEYEYFDDSFDSWYDGYL